MNDRAPQQPRRQFSRRLFLQTTGATAVAVGLTGSLTSCSDDDDGAPTRLTGGETYSGAAPTPTEAPDAGKLHFFTRAEAQTINAMAARIVPGDADDPGAIECDVLTYIDNKLDLYEGGFGQGIYRHPPYLESTPDGASVDIPAPNTVSDDDIDRYGYQSPYTYREIFRLGLVALDRSVSDAGGTRFSDLDTADQDVVLSAVADGSVKGFDPPGAKTFFTTVRSHVIEGLLCDPLYGGNQGLQGWKLTGYPGAQRAYTPEYLHGETAEYEPQSIADMMAFNPGRGDLGGDQVVSGSRDGREHGDHPTP